MCGGRKGGLGVRWVCMLCVRDWEDGDGRGWGPGLLLLRFESLGLRGGLDALLNSPFEMSSSFFLLRGLHLKVVFSSL